MMKLLFVVNPISGGIDKEPFLRKAKALCNKYNIAYYIFKTTGKNDEEELKKLLLKHLPDKVVSVGGDGTTLFTALALMDTSFPMGIVPQGSANGMARELYVNTIPIEALKDIIMSERIEGVDMLKVNDEHYTMHLGDVGVNAQLVKSYEKDPKRGMATYARYFIEELKKLKRFPVKIYANDREYKDQILMVAICNARKYGTGVPLNVDGSPMDGKFELVLIHKIDAKSLIKSVLASFDEQFMDTESGKTIVTDSAEIVFDEPRLLQLDGEVIGEFKNIKIEILKGAVRFITHGDNAYIN
jgi:diacylglycerol kinase family enzyme